MNFRKIVFAAAVVAGMGFAASAEVHPHAIGIRFGGGWEVNYQMGLGSANRFEIGGGLDVSSGEHWYEPHNRNYKTSHVGFGAFGAYQWHWNINPSFARGGFNWYFGPGAGVGFWSNDVAEHPGRNDYKNSGINIDAGGQIGIEYDFNVLGAPILLDIDSRPTAIHISGGSFNIGPGFDLALAVRFTF